MKISSNVRLIPILPLLVAALSSCVGPATSPRSTPTPTPSFLSSHTATPVPTLAPTPTPSQTPQILTVGGFGTHSSIQKAIDAAEPGSTIQVAQGTYLENITISSPKSIRLEGGWNGGFSSRSDDSSLTVVDGKGSGTCINMLPRDGVTIDVTIDGFTIQNGNADSGGAIRVNSSGVNSRVSLTLDHNTITRNKVTGWGGGVFTQASGEGSTVIIVLAHNVIRGNTANDRGGGVFIRSTKGSIDVTLTNNTISGNWASNEGGGMRVESTSGGSAVVTLARNTITGNIARDLDGGGIAAYASGSGTTTLTLTNNLIVGNEASCGGGVFGYAWGRDAATTMVLTNNIIAANKAPIGGGIFSCSGVTDSNSKPGGLTTWVLTNNTITSNTVTRNGSGVGLFSGEGGLMNLSSHNDIIWGNTDTEQGPQVHVVVEKGKSGVATVKAWYSDIGLIGAYGGATYTTDNVINRDPLFIDPMNQDFRLQDGSPCIDSGDPDSSFNDGQRPLAKGTERNDMGVYGGPENSDWPH